VQYLFKNTDPVGETIKINNIPFEVIGVLNSRGASYDNANEDDMTFIPLNTGMRRVFNVDYIKNIYAQTVGKETIPSAEKQIRKILREQHRLNSRNYEDDFTIQNVYTAIKAESDTDRSFTFLVLGVAALSLLVGGVGLLATMLLSVKERKSEIGLRMAVGAKVRDILLQFLLESVLLSLLGGIAGIIAGVIGTIFIGIFTDLPAGISYQSALITFIISVCIGVFFGTFPARKASTIQPVNALKD
jgi:putative ABC transport system permease protein